MSIQAIITQPAANSVHAAYRPVALRVSATTNTAGGGPIPPVVYCDIYFGAIFYKTISKTQYTSSNGSVSQWEFDIQDAGQEYLRKYIAGIAESSIVEATTLVVETYCKFRCSGYDTNGFIASDGTAPVQGTSSSDPVAGTGTQSNTFYIVNATLQHKDSQDLATHLTAFKTRTWTANALPLTHRPDGYAIAPGDSDSFPILYLGSGQLQTVRLNYRYCNQSTFSQASLNVGPPPACTSTISDPIAVHNDLGWYISWSVVSGSPAKFYVSTPAYSGGAPSDTSNTFVQWPELAIGTHVITVRPLCLIGGEYYFGAARTVTIVVGACVAADFAGEPDLPQANPDTIYNYTIALTGTAPFTLTDIVKPTWMSISVSGSNIVFGGSPTEADIDDDVPVSFTINNCADDTLDFTGTLDVVESGSGDGGTIIVRNTVPGSSITGVSPVFYALIGGSFPIPNGSSVSGVVSAFTGVVSVDITLVGSTGYLRLIVESVLIDCQPVSASGTYSFPSHAYLITSGVEIELSQNPC